MTQKNIDNKKKSNTIHQITIVAMLCAVSVVLSALESMVEILPFMIPGMKLGLSNVAVMFALEVCSLPSAFCVVLFKAIFALVTRGGTAFLMSFFGGFCATLAMYLLLSSKRVRFGYIGVGITGAVLHNTGQLMVAFLLVGEAVAAYALFLIFMSLITGSLTGFLNFLTLPYVRKIPTAGKNISDDM